MRRRTLAVLGMAAAVCAGPAPARAFDPDGTFAKDTMILSLQGGGGEQNNIEGHGRLSNISFVNFTPRVAILPFDPLGSGWYRGALETGVEGWFQYYLDPDGATAEGAKLAARYHFLGIGRLVPYVEATAGAAGTSLKVLEIRSNFSFVLEAGAGVSYFVTDTMALTGGYRFQHISNGNVERPNRGFNSDTGTLGVSYFFR